MKSLLQKVKSSNIDGIGFDTRTDLLYVMFRGGGMYTYHPFTQKEFNRFEKANSKGKWFAEHVKDNPKLAAQKVSK